jgi:microcystin degradation protein MlrC
VCNRAFLAAVRRAVGPDCYVIATLDLHSNISDQMVSATDCMVAMRTNPHVDTAQRGEESAVCLLQMLCGVARPFQMAVRLPLCPPAVRQLTALGQPYGNVLRHGQQLLDGGALQHIMNISAVSGFPWSDTPKNGFTVIVTARDRDDPLSVTAAKETAVELAQLAWAQLDDFKPNLTDLSEHRSNTQRMWHVLIDYSHIGAHRGTHI